MHSTSGRRPTARHAARALVAVVAPVVLIGALTSCSNDGDGNMFDGSTAVNVTQDTVANPGTLGTAPASQTSVAADADTTAVGPGGTGPMGTSARGGAAVPGTVTPTVADTPETRTAFCRSVVELDAAFGASPPVNDSAALRTLAERLRPLAERLPSLAPEPVAGSARVLADAIRDVGTSGEAAALVTPGFRQASDQLGTWAHLSCGFQQVEVIVSDQGFTGIPGRLRPRTTSFRVRATGGQDHVLVLARKKAGVSDDALALLRAGLDEMSVKVDVVGAVYVAEGDVAEGTAELTAGSYFAFCDVPRPDGRPHYLDGGLVSFRVR